MTATNERGAWSCSSNPGARRGKYRRRSRLPSPRRVNDPIGLWKVVKGIVSSSSSGSAGVVEDHAERHPLAGGDRAHAVAQGDTVITAPARVRALAGREDHERALRRAQNVGAALSTRAPLEQHELTTGVVHLRVREHGQNLEREVHLAVQILVK